MTALASTDVTVTISERRIVGKKRRNLITIAFGNSTLTYPSGGVPMPTYGSFGMVRQLDFLNLLDQDNASGVFWKYDKTNNKLRAYAQSVTTGATATGALSNGAFAIDNQGAETVARISGTAISTSYSLGVLKEVGTSYAPAAASLVVEAVGW
jgi:hypothetical protein